MLSRLPRKTENLFHRYTRALKLARILNQDRTLLQTLVTQIEHDTSFFGYIQTKMQKNTRYTPSHHDFEYSAESGSVFFSCTTLYAIVRAKKPLLIKEQ